MKTVQRPEWNPVCRNACINNFQKFNTFRNRRRRAL